MLKSLRNEREDQHLGHQIERSAAYPDQSFPTELYPSLLSQLYSHHLTQRDEAGQKLDWTIPQLTSWRLQQCPRSILSSLRVQKYQHEYDSRHSWQCRGRTRIYDDIDRLEEDGQSKSSLSRAIHEWKPPGEYLPASAWITTCKMTFSNART